MHAWFVELYIGIFAVLKAGAAYIPMDPEYPADRLVIMAEDSEVSLIDSVSYCQIAQGPAGLHLDACLTVYVFSAFCSDSLLHDPECKLGFGLECLLCFVADFVLHPHLFMCLLQHVGLNGPD